VNVSVQNCSEANFVIVAVSDFILLFAVRILWAVGTAGGCNRLLHGRDRKAQGPGDP
jgi:hypothetical protein